MGWKIKYLLPIHIEGESKHIQKVVPINISYTFTICIPIVCQNLTHHPWLQMCILHYGLSLMCGSVNVVLCRPTAFYLVGNIDNFQTDQQESMLTTYPTHYLVSPRVLCLDLYCFLCVHVIWVICIAYFGPCYPDLFYSKVKWTWMVKASAKTSKHLTISLLIYSNTWIDDDFFFSGLYQYDKLSMTHYQKLYWLWW